MNKSSVKKLLGAAASILMLTAVGTAADRPPKYKTLEQAGTPKTSSAEMSKEVKIVVIRKDPGDANLVEIWQDGKKVFSLQTHRGASVMRFDNEKSGDHRRGYSEFLADGDDFRKYLVDLKGDGDKRHLIIVDWHGGNSAFGYEGYLLDAKDHFAYLGKVPAGEICDYPAVNPDLEFVYCEEVAYFGASGAAVLRLPMRAVKGKNIPVPGKNESFDLLPYSKDLKSDYTDKQELRRMTFIRLYADLATHGVLKKGPEFARQLGYTPDETKQYQKEALQMIHRGKFWQYLKKIND